MLLRGKFFLENGIFQDLSFVLILALVVDEKAFLEHLIISSSPEFQQIQIISNPQFHFPKFHTILKTLKSSNSSELI